MNSLNQTEILYQTYTVFILGPKLWEFAFILSIILVSF